MQRKRIQATQEQLSKIDILKNKQQALNDILLSPVSLLGSVTEYFLANVYIDISSKDKFDALSTQIRQVAHLTNQSNLLVNVEFQDKLNDVNNWRVYKQFALSAVLPLLYALTHFGVRHLYSSLTTPQDHDELNFNEADKLIETLQKENQQLEINIQRMSLILAAITIFLVPYICIGLAIKQEVTPIGIMQVLFLYHFGSIIDKSLLPLLADFKLRRRIHDLLIKKENLLIDALNLSEQKQLYGVTLYESKQLNTSYFSIKIGNYKGKNAIILKEAVTAQITKRILLKNGVKVISLRKDFLTVSAELNLNATDVKKINKELDSALNEYCELLALEKQIKELAQVLSTEAFRVDISVDGSIQSKFYMHLPEKYASLLNKEYVKSLFGDKTKFVKQGERVIISGGSPFSKEKISFKDKLQELTKVVAKVDAAMLASQTNPNQDAQAEQIIFLDPAIKSRDGGYSEEVKNTDIKKESKGKEHLEREPTKKELLLQQIAAEKEKAKKTTKPQMPIVWKSGSYDPNKNNNDIHEIEAGTRLPEDTFYIKLDIKPEDVKKYPGFFDKIKETAKKAHFANGRMGAEGFDFIDPEEVKGVNKKAFTATGMLKFLGVFSDARAYAEAETADNGEVLYVVKGFNPHAH